jgi:hypothetical protein
MTIPEPDEISSRYPQTTRGIFCRLYHIGKYLKYPTYIIIINLTPFEPRAMRVSYISLQTRENLTTFVAG